MELRGKNAFVVFDDATVDKVVKGTVEGVFFNKGEACTASSRVFVQKNIYSEFVKRVIAAIGQLRTGNGLEEQTHVGPVVSKAQKVQVLDMIERGKHEDATLAIQGSLPKDPALAEGYFMPPTVFTDVSPDMAIARKEIFGPVPCISSFDSEDEVVTVVNDSKYSLFAGVLREWSRVKNILFPSGFGAIPIWRGATQTCVE